MVVAQLRGCEFEIDTTKSGYLPIATDESVAVRALREVAHWFGYKNVDSYLEGLNTLGEKIKDRIKEKNLGVG